MISTQHTPGCSGSERELFTTTDVNRKVSRESFTYLRCDRCGLIRLANAPQDLDRYYPTEYYEVPDIEKLRATARSDPFKITTTQAFVDRGRLLDIGPAYGTFALQAKLAGFEVDTIEMDARCCDYLRNAVGVNAICSADPAEAMGSLGAHDVITLWHVIEHLPDPWSVLSAAASNLAPGGVLIIASPNPDSWQFGVMGKRWPHVDAPRHLYLLPRKVLSAYVKQFGLDSVSESTTDHDARGWNRFGWQRLIMNMLPGKWLKRAGFVTGYLLSFAMAPFESAEPKGAAYTLVFQKAAA